MVLGKATFISWIWRKFSWKDSREGEKGRRKGVWSRSALARHSMYFLALGPPCRAFTVESGTFHVCFPRLVNGLSRKNVSFPPWNCRLCNFPSSYFYSSCYFEHQLLKSRNEKFYLTRSTVLHLTTTTTALALRRNHLTTYPVVGQIVSGPLLCDCSNGLLLKLFAQCSVCSTSY